VQKAIAVALIAVGVVLLVFGYDASQSLSSEVSRVVTGSPSDRAIMMRMHGDAAVEPASGESTMTLLAALPLAHASAHPIRPGIELVTGFPEP